MRPAVLRAVNLIEVILTLRIQILKPQLIQTARTGTVILIIISIVVTTLTRIIILTADRAVTLLPLVLETVALGVILLVI